jgi:hypothetical protein
MECPICKKVINKSRGLSQHLKNQHGNNVKEVYDTYIKQESEGKCKTCNNQTSFRGITVGYLEFCSPKCRSSNPEYRGQMSESASGKKQSQETINKRIANTNQKTKEENRIKSLQERYGQNVTNPSQTPTYRKNYQKTSLKNWGVSHPSSAPECFKTKRLYKKRTINVNGYEFSDIQGYEDVFLNQLNDLFPNVSYENLLEERSKTLFMTNNKVHYPDFYSKKDNHMFEIKSKWTFENHKDYVLYKKKEAELQGYTYTIIIWERRTSKAIIIS